MRWRHCVAACACMETTSTRSGVGRGAESFGRCRVVGIAEQLHPQFGLLQRLLAAAVQADAALVGGERLLEAQLAVRSEEHTSELQSLMRISYAVFCLNK